MRGIESESESEPGRARERDLERGRARECEEERERAKESEGGQIERESEGERGIVFWRGRHGV